MTVPVSVDHVARGLSRLTSRFASQPNIVGITTVLLKEVQAIEDAIQFYLFIVQLSNHPYPGGPWDVLDRIGKIVGEPRLGRSDADYVPAIKIRIRVNRSNGLAEDIIQIAALLEPNPFYYDAYPAAFVLDVRNAAVPHVGALLEYLSDARSAGTAGQLHYTTWPDSAGLFVFGDSTGSSVGATGFQDSVAGGFPDGLASLGDL